MSDEKKELIRSELLCFMQQKSTVLEFDDIVTITADFYTSDEVKGAVASVQNYIDFRMPTYKTTDKDKTTSAASSATVHSHCMHCECCGIMVSANLVCRRFSGRSLCLGCSG